MKKLKSLGLFQSRKIGNSRVITIPTSGELADDQIYELAITADQSLIYRPVLKNDNPWLNGSAANYDFANDIKYLDFEITNANSLGNEQRID